MKRALLAVLVAAGLAGAWQWYAWKRAEQALVASVCANELTEPLSEMLSQTKEAMVNGDTVAGAALFFKRRQLYEGSSLAPHLATIRRLPEPSIHRLKALAVVVSETCPDVYPEPIKAERPLANLWLLAFDDR